MSNALAIAHVTQALALLIEANLQPEIDMAVKVEPRKPSADPPADPTITVFLYQVTPNTSQRNNDLPTRASDGTLLKRPAAALDLHFLISAYGEESELVGQRLIGSVVRTLHEIPVLPKDIIELAGEKPYLAGSDLAEAAQRVRFSPTVMDIDETSKLWGMLHQTPYTLSVVYQAALVFIEGREVPVAAKPVERSAVRVVPFGAPGAPVPPGASVNGSASPEGGGSGETSGGAGAKAGAETPAKPEAEPEAKPVAKAAAKTPAKAPVKAPVKATAKASARARKEGQPNKSAQSGKSAQPGRSARGAAKSTGAATSASPGSSADASDASTVGDGPERTEN
ncbi:Pvc16 family protein [Streptomyces phaeochromogenes]